ncbi:MAG: hypothetical protein ACRDWW_03050 [Acidimicrobiales bacterium]
MFEGEELVAERVVEIHDNQTLNVRISQHAADEFWRVDIQSLGATRGTTTTTVGFGDSFLVHLIHDAVREEQAAWRHLAECGHANLARSAPSLRCALA